ncbi:MAG: uracil-DNA glycosylase [candidate division Zixibacteria bacterium]|nr:uracil-DNA glycosylase [candidate division Zixibacteria bacterium]
MTLKKNIKEPEMPENIQKLEKIEIPDKLEKSIEITKYRSLTGHYKAICDCQNCSLGATRTKFVYGVGNPKADVMFVGEAPGRDEDLSGEPFVGRAGKLLDKILEAIQFSRENQVYIANILKCRPPNNRDPQPDEMKTCMPYLREQIRIIKPKIICALGRVAAQALLDTTTPLGKLRGSWHEFENTPFIVTYHPAALLRFQKYKKDCWEDIKMLKAKYDILVQE